MTGAGAGGGGAAGIRSNSDSDFQRCVGRVERGLFSS